MIGVFNGEPCEIDARPITLVFNSTHGQSSYPGRFVIDDDASMLQYGWVDEIRSEAAAMFKSVVHDFEGEASKAVLDTCQPCFRRLAGMLDLTVRLVEAGVPIVWKYPEDGLHPRYQGNLADVAIFLSGRRGR